MTPLKHRLEKKWGVNGQQYYHVDYDILATFHSAHVEYKWRYKGTYKLFSASTRSNRGAEGHLTVAGEIFNTVKARYQQQ